MVIVAAVDRSDRATHVVEEGATLARAFGERLHVVHVMSESAFVDLQRDSIEQTGKPVDRNRIEQYAIGAAEEAAEGLDVEYEPVGLVGNAKEEIIRYANDHEGSYIVVGPRKRSPTGKALFGSVAQTVLLNADCPVVSIVHG